MTILTFNDDSLKRGKTNAAEVKEALDDPLGIEVEQSTSKQGNPTIMYVGKTLTEKLLEIGVEYKEYENHIYHARKANAKYRRKYEDTSRRQT